LNHIDTQQQQQQQPVLNATDDTAALMSEWFQWQLLVALGDKSYISSWQVGINSCMVMYK
jgi:hypothetical protein